MTSERPDADERRGSWNERHKEGDFEGRGPNPTLMAALGDSAPSAVGIVAAVRGTALELGSGSGTNAVWLASQGWRVTAVDWSAVGLANGREKAAAAGVEVEWLERDLFEWAPPARAFDLVILAYLHLPPEERRPVYAAAAAAVAPGGRLVVVAHDRLNAREGPFGPPEAVLFTAAELGTELATADAELSVDRTEVVRQVPPTGRGLVDALLVMRRAAAPRAADL